MRNKASVKVCNGIGEVEYKFKYKQLIKLRMEIRKREKVSLENVFKQWLSNVRLDKPVFS
jgi:hypothetical protein